MLGSRQLIHELLENEGEGERCYCCCQTHSWPRSLSVNAPPTLRIAKLNGLAAEVVLSWLKAVMCNRHMKPLNVHLLKAHKGLLLPTHKIHNLSLSAAPFPACQENLNDSPAATPLRHVVNVVRQSLCKPAYSAATTPKHPLRKHHTPTIPCAKALPERNGRCECFDCQSSTRSCAGSNKLAKACCNSTQQKCAPTAGNHLSWKRFPGLTPPPLPTLEPKPSLPKRKTAQMILLMLNVRQLRCQHAGGRKIPCD